MVTLRKYEPFDPWTRDVERVFSRMLDLPNRFFGEESGLAGWQPRMDVKESDASIFVRMDLPNPPKYHEMHDGKIVPVNPPKIIIRSFA